MSRAYASEKNPQVVTINIHRPQVQRIRRDGDNLVITLGNDAYHGSVTLFVTDEQWTALRLSVLDFQVAERGVDEVSADRYCPECAYIGVDGDDVTEHVFGNHPEAVAR